MVKELCSQVLGSKYGHYDLVKYGSAVNGLSVRGEQEESDLDLVLVIPSILSADLQAQYDEEVSIFGDLAKALKHQITEFKEIIYFGTSFGQILSAKVIATNISIDLQINKVVDVYNSYLIQQYAK